MSTLWPAEERLRRIDWAPVDALRTDIVEALRPVLAGAEATRCLTALLRRKTGTWNGSERAAAAEAVLGVALWRRRLRFHAQDDSAGALLEVLVRRLGSALCAPEEAPCDWPTRLSYPDWLAGELKVALKAEAEVFAAASNLPGPITVRVNGLRLGREALAQRLRGEGVEATPTAFAPDGLVLQGRPNVLGLGSHQEGLFEVQDEGSQLVGLCVGAQPGESVLDICAGSGGKTLLLGVAMKDRGRLDAYDVDQPALERLEHRAARAGLRTSLRILRALPEGYKATRVLVDAPCSALGTLRRGPDARWRLQADSLAALPAVQKHLLEVAALHTALDGRLVYATCTIRPEENEQVVEHFLAVHEDFKQETAAVPEALRASDGALRTFPHRHGMDGFYAAVLHRRA
jgi:16S rRNA (cytosine967-C5)-methyltransferase